MTKEVSRLVVAAHDSALKLLGERLETLHQLASALLVEETLDAEAVEAVVTGKPRPRAPDANRPRPTRPLRPRRPRQAPPAAAPPEGGGAGGRMTRPNRHIPLPGGSLELGPAHPDHGRGQRHALIPSATAGMFFEEAKAVEQGMALAEAGADILDVGGESTRPGSDPQGWTRSWSGCCR